jgi:Excalibur calcium-binding domain
MRKARLFNLARKRHSAVRWGIAGFAVATVALFAAPDMASTIGRSTQLAAVATPAPHGARSAEPKLTRVSCSDFDNQEEAQAFLASHTVSDPHRLDADNDGRVCEQLP